MSSIGLGGGLRILFLSAPLLALAACQSGGETGETMSKTDVAQPNTKISQTDLESFCPPVRVREGTATHTAYAKGGQDDATKITYQASISEVSRACTSVDGTMTITVAVAGRIVPGPAGAPASVTMPIRIAATRGDEVLYSQMLKQQVAVDSAGAAAQFLVKDSNIVIPVPDRPNVSIQIGFDAGPAKRK